MKLGRNDPCWCGSGKKFKKCHLNRERESPPQLSEVINQAKKFRNRKYCLHPEAGSSTCRGQIVQAHTVQKGRNLTRIARGGKVYQFVPELGALLRTGQQVGPSLIGINQASTIWGFCARHDNEVFRLIDYNDFEPCVEHAFLLGYRSLSRELYWKSARLDALAYMKTLDRGKIQIEQKAHQEISGWAGDGLRQGLDDLRREKKRYDQVLLRRDYDSGRYYALILDQTPDILCSGFTQVEYDFAGTFLQDLSDPNLDPHCLACSIVASQHGGAVVFTWVEDSLICSPFIKSLDAFTDERIGDAVTRFVFECFENLYVSPEWWDALSEQTAKALVDRMCPVKEMFSARSSRHLVEDEKRYVSWNALSRKTNGI
jgi:hypothetical protein